MERPAVIALLVVTVLTSLLGPASATARSEVRPVAQMTGGYHGCGSIRLNGYKYRASAKGLSCLRARRYLRWASDGIVPRGYSCAASAYVCWTGRSYERSRHVFRAFHPINDERPRGAG